MWFCGGVRVLERRKLKFVIYKANYDCILNNIKALGILKSGRESQSFIVRLFKGVCGGNSRFSWLFDW